MMPKSPETQEIQAVRVRSPHIATEILVDVQLKGACRSGCRTATAWTSEAGGGRLARLLDLPGGHADRSPGSRERWPQRLG